MRRQHDIGTFQAGVDEGFVFEDVESGAGDLAAFESVDQRSLIDNRPACRVDEECGRLHAKELGRVKQATCFRQERNVHADEVALGKEGRAQ